MGFSRRTYLTIENQTLTRISNIEVSGIWNHDWDGHSRPDYNFHGFSIAAGASLTRREEVNSLRGRAVFVMKLIFQNGLVDSFFICQKYAIGKCAADFKHYDRSHDIFYRREGDKTLKITIKSTQQQINDEKAEQLSKEAKKNSTMEQHLQQLNKFDAALRSVKNDTRAIQKLKKGKSETYAQMGKLAMENGCKLENQLQSAGAMKEFQNAKQFFQNVQNLGFVNSKSNIDVLNSKIDGSNLFNEAVILDEKALNLYKTNQSSLDNDIVQQIKNNYEQALSKYEQTKKIFERGAKLNSKMFAESIQIVNVAIIDVKQSIEEATSTELLVNFGNMYLNVGEKIADQIQEEESVNIYKQIE